MIQEPTVGSDLCAAYDGRLKGGQVKEIEFDEMWHFIESLA
jgi:hypothetical protein